MLSPNGIQREMKCLAIKQPVKGHPLSQGWKPPLCHKPALTGSTGWWRGISLTLPHPPPCKPVFHCREQIRWPVGVKKSHILLCMQLCPSLRVPALRAAFFYGDTAPASLPAATHTSQARSTDGAALDQPVPLWADIDSSSPRTMQ